MQNRVSAYVETCYRVLLSSSRPFDWASDRASGWISIYIGQEEFEPIPIINHNQYQAEAVD